MRPVLCSSRSPSSSAHRGGRFSRRRSPFAAYGGVALTALAINPRAGVVLGGLALAAHAGWDAVHYRRGIVVPRSLAEACVALDVPLGLGIVVLGLTG